MTSNRNYCRIVFAETAYTQLTANCRGLYIRSSLRLIPRAPNIPFQLTTNTTCLCTLLPNTDLKLRGYLSSPDVPLVKYMPSITASRHLIGSDSFIISLAVSVWLKVKIIMNLAWWY